MIDTAKEFVKWTVILIASGLIVEYIWHTGLGQTLLAHAEGLPLGNNIGPKITTMDGPNFVRNNTSLSDVQILMV